MDSCEKEFESAGQEARRLAIALKRFTEVQDPVWKEKYQHYLSLRFRPAISELIRQDDFFVFRNSVSLYRSQNPHSTHLLRKPSGSTGKKFFPSFWNSKKTTLAFMTMTLPSDTDKE